MWRHRQQPGVERRTVLVSRDVLHLDIGVVELLPRARMPTKVPVVLSPSEVRQVLDQLSGVPRIVATLLYGAGSGCRSAWSCG